ncbi:MULTISPECIES: hypothetical protein [unclassified Bradyrhizobium]|uniref:hypothetical protein n=1 Tax=unclassified Bradyrhizobium TaxID=2631580 RepID=UPI0004268E80|nr:MULTISPECIES: hypothetical protein [unclassified Bradyrhizobium]MCP3466419.1 hypothetical protein [Bradyrhizobium sp. CCGUVB23]
MNGITTTVITYSDGTTEVETSVSAQGGQSQGDQTSQAGQTYTAQGTLGTTAGST